MNDPDEVNSGRCRDIFPANVFSQDGQVLSSGQAFLLNPNAGIYQPKLPWPEGIDPKSVARISLQDRRIVPLKAFWKCYSEVDVEHYHFQLS